MEPVLCRRVDEAALTFLLSDGCLVRPTTELDFPPYIDVRNRSTHTPAHCPWTRRLMQRSAPITNETEFQEWLVAVLEAERDKLREAAAVRESQKCISLEGFEKDTTQEIQHEDER